MEIKEFIQNFADQFDEIKVETLNAETKFRELEEWTSLVALSIMAMIDDEYDVVISADEMRNAQTILQLFDTVKAKL